VPSGCGGQWLQDIGHDPKLPTTRLYATSEAQPFHNDSADIVGARRCLHVEKTRHTENAFPSAVPLQREESRGSTPTTNTEGSLAMHAVNADSKDVPCACCLCYLPVFEGCSPQQ
jgi:hypothetical protein